MFPPNGPAHHGSWYCLGCGVGSGSEASIKSHVFSCQPEDHPQQGVTHAAGWQVEQMRERLLEESAPRIRVFVAALRQDNYGPDDFLTDCGLMSL